MAGPISKIGAWLAFPVLLLRECSLAKAKVGFDYLVTERTRPVPALMLEALFDTLVKLAARSEPAQGTLGRELARHRCAIAWLALLQFPSSRAFGAPPVPSRSEYDARIPDDPDERAVVPVPPRPFPEALHDDDLLPARPHPSDIVVRIWAIAPLVAIVVALVFVLR